MTTARLARKLPIFSYHLKWALWKSPAYGQGSSSRLRAPQDSRPHAHKVSEISNTAGALYRHFMVLGQGMRYVPWKATFLFVVLVAFRLKVMVPVDALADSVPAISPPDDLAVPAA